MLLLFLSERERQDNSISSTSQFKLASVGKCELCTHLLDDSVGCITLNYW